MWRICEKLGDKLWNWPFELHECMKCDMNVFLEIINVSIGENTLQWTKKVIKLHVINPLPPHSIIFESPVFFCSLFVSHY